MKQYGISVRGLWFYIENCIPLDRFHEVDGRQYQVFKLCSLEFCCYNTTGSTHSDCRHVATEIRRNSELGFIFVVHLIISLRFYCEYTDET